MSMTVEEALGMIKAKLTCMKLEDLASIEKGCDRDCDNCNYCYEQGNRGQGKEALAIAIKALEEVKQLHAIGTVSEFRELKEKATAKQVYGVYIDEDKVRYECPHCHKYLNFNELRYCSVCGQKLDWSEGKE